MVRVYSLPAASPSPAPPRHLSHAEHRSRLATVPGLAAVGQPELGPTGRASRQETPYVARGAGRGLGRGRRAGAVSRMADGAGGHLSDIG